jgi:hypothetical protein
MSRFLLLLFFGLLFVPGLFSIRNVGTSNKVIPNLEFSVDELDGRIQNRFFRQNNVAAHVVANSTRFSVIVGFANGGNSGAAVWFEPDAKMQLNFQGGVSLAAMEDGLYGVSTEITAEGVDHLTLDYSIVGSIRAIRNFEDVGRKTPGFEGVVELDSARNQVRITRYLTPEHRYSFALQAEEGSAFESRNGKVVLTSTQGPPRFRVTARSSEPLLTGLSAHELIREEYLPLFDQQALNMLSFVAYREKWMAGSHRYLTYFGRDTLLSMKLMLPFLKPEAVAGALAGVLDRVDQRGWVSHEETLADYAYFESGQQSFEPRQNREHIDANYMLPGLMNDYLHMVDVSDGNTFLNRHSPDGRTYREVVESNLRLLLKDAAPFYLHKNWHSFVHLEKDPTTNLYRKHGQWRDSREGLDDGVIPYDVNVVLVPAALANASELFNNHHYGLFEARYAGEAKNYLSVWSKDASEFFKIKIPKLKAQKMGEAFMAQKSNNLLMPDPLDEDLTYYALSLNADGTKSQVMHSDIGERLLYGFPSDAELITICDLFTREAPFGLQTAIGPVAAMPAFASPATQAMFTRDHYHGFMAWGRELAIAMTGMVEQQWPRKDISISARLKLQDAVKAMWRAMERTKDFRTAESWTWENDGYGHMIPTVFGSKREHKTASNPVQLWSLAVALGNRFVSPRVAEISSSPVVQSASGG